MIHFVVTRDHMYPMARMLGGEYGNLSFQWKQFSYEELFEAEEIVTGTWIFQDIERLVEWERLRAAKIASALVQAGARILNHPSLSAGRYELQRRLFARGINAFQVFRSDEHRPPTRWPVFVRFEHDHRSPDARLIHDIGQLRTVLNRYVQQSIPLSSLLIVEYYGEQGDDELWRKYAAYRVGDEIVHHHMIRQDSWLAKHGNSDLPIDEAAWKRLRIEERDYLESQDDPHRLMRGFQVGALEFGRVDYNLVGGVAQIYEINTNPVIGEAQPEGDKCPDIPRAQLHRRANARIIDALGRIDTTAARRVRIGSINKAPKRP